MSLLLTKGQQTNTLPYLYILLERITQYFPLYCNGKSWPENKLTISNVVWSNCYIIFNYAQGWPRPRLGDEWTTVRSLCHCQLATPRPLPPFEAFKSKIDQWIFNLFRHMFFSYGFWMDMHKLSLVFIGCIRSLCPYNMFLINSFWLDQNARN